MNLFFPFIVAVYYYIEVIATLRHDCDELLAACFKVSVIINKFHVPIRRKRSPLFLYDRILAFAVMIILFTDRTVRVHMVFYALLLADTVRSSCKSSHRTDTKK